MEPGANTPPTITPSSRLGRTAFFVHVLSLVTGGLLVVLGLAFGGTDLEKTAALGVGLALGVCGMFWSLLLAYRARRETHLGFSNAVLILVALEFLTLGAVEAELSFGRLLGTRWFEMVLLKYGVAWIVPLAIVLGALTPLHARRITNRFEQLAARLGYPPWTDEKRRRTRLRCVWASFALLLLLSAPLEYVMIGMDIDGKPAQNLIITNAPEWMIVFLYDNWATTRARQRMGAEGRLPAGRLKFIVEESGNSIHGECAYLGWCGPRNTSASAGDHAALALKILRREIKSINLSTNVNGWTENAGEELGKFGTPEQIRPFLAPGALGIWAFGGLIRILAEKPEIARELRPELLILKVQGTHFRTDSCKAYWNSFTKEEFLSQISKLLQEDPADVQQQLQDAFDVQGSEAQLLQALRKSSVKAKRWAVAPHFKYVSSDTLQEIEKYWDDPDLEVRRGVTRLIAGGMGEPLKYLPTYDTSSLIFDELKKPSIEIAAEIEERAALKKTLEQRKAERGKWPIASRE